MRSSTPLQQIGWRPTSLIIQGETGTGRRWRSRCVAGPARTVPLSCSIVRLSAEHGVHLFRPKGVHRGHGGRRISEDADGGTLLDEIADLDIELGETAQSSSAPRSTALGRTNWTRVDVRGIAHKRNLRRSGGSFRDDLYYRLA